MDQEPTQEERDEIAEGLLGKAHAWADLTPEERVDGIVGWRQKRLARIAKEQPAPLPTRTQEPPRPIAAHPGDEFVNAAFEGIDALVRTKIAVLERELRERIDAAIKAIDERS